MPELPEVETIRRQLVGPLIGRRITGSTAHSSAKFNQAQLAVGTTITTVGRRGKYLLVGLSGDRELVVHLGMTGSLRIRPSSRDCTTNAPTRDLYVRAVWNLDDGSALEFRDVRRFGRIAVVTVGEYASMPTLAALGPEPWDEMLDRDGLWSELSRSRRAIKTHLLSQRPIAGVGNIYADEALWSARINPADRSVTRPGAVRLLAAIREVLTVGIDNGGTTLRDYVDATGGQGSNQHQLRCYGRGGQPCPRCGATLRSTALDGRTTTWCPTCQPRRRR